jgi:cellulose biosynthesis protein BcsQ
VPVRKIPYVLVVGSHKGGTGRTTSALALAWLWGQAGLKVALIDADPVRAARLVAVTAKGACPWDNVRFFPDLAGSADALLGNELVVIDCPALTTRSAQRVLRLADGIVLTCLAEPLSLRTLPSAAAAVRRARQANPRLESLGILVGRYKEEDRLQGRMLRRLRRTQGARLLEPAIPYQPEVTTWPLEPGSAMPGGPAREAYAVLANGLDTRIGRLTAV